MATCRCTLCHDNALRADVELWMLSPQHLDPSWNHSFPDDSSTFYMHDLKSFSQMSDFASDWIKMCIVSVGPGYQVIHSTYFFVTVFFTASSICISSVNFISSYFLFTSQSLMKMLNSIGPNAYLCRTPLEILLFDDVSPLNIFWDLSVSHCLIHTNYSLLILDSANF